jgi:hypothetical protein
VRPIPLTEAKSIIEKHEYLGKMPAVARWAFGIFFGERIGGVAVFGDEYCENLGNWDRYGFAGKIVALLAWRMPAVTAADPGGIQLTVEVSPSGLFKQNIGAREQGNPAGRAQFLR